MKSHIDEITADIKAADFSTDANTLTFAEKMCSDYPVRDLFTYEDFLPRWNFNTIGEKQRVTRTWKRITNEARSLIVQVRTLGAGAIKNRLVCGAHGVKLPHPQMCDDLDDDLFGMSIDALRRMAARAMESNATIQDVAHKVDAARGELAAIGADAERGADAAESAERIANETFAAVGDVARNVGAVRNDLVTVNYNAIKAKDAAQAIALELKDWRKWIAACVENGGANAQHDQEQTTTPPMFAAARDAIYELWQKFKAEPADCEMHNGGLREPGQKRTFAECLERYGATVIYTSPYTGQKRYLKELCPTADDLQKAVNAARMAKTRTKAAHKRRTPKRKK